MEKKKLSTNKRTATFLALADEVRETEPTGFYNAKTDTWSNRRYSNVATKKHNEAM
jgi:hypothetical protein